MRTSTTTMINLIDSLLQRVSNIAQAKRIFQSALKLGIGTIKLLRPELDFLTSEHRGKQFRKVQSQAVIKSAASAASPKAKSREGSSRGAPRAVVRIRSVVRPAPSSHRAPSPGAPLELPSLDFAFGEAALAADLITA